jgi:hypothetical protein
MRAQFFYITGINALEDAAGYFYSERDKSDTKSNQICVARHYLVTTIATRVNRVYR